MNQPEIKKNPFMEPYETLHDTVPFDKIKFEHYEEAFMEGIRRDNESIAKIVENPDTPTFRNTIAVEDDSKGKHYYDLLDRVSTVFSCMMSANTNDKMEELAQKISPILTQHGNDLIFNKKLFERVKYVHDHHENLTPEEQTLLDKEYDAFVRSGALLGDKDKERLRKLTEEAGILTLQFSQNLLKESKAYTLHITDKADLEGLPDTAIEAAAAAAKEKNMEGWLFTLDYPSYSPFMSYAKNRDLREQMYMARNTECIKNNDENNLKICQRLINLRREIAQLIGYETYADYVLKHRMAGSTRRVYKLLDDLIDAYKPKAIEELNDIKAKARAMEGENFELKPWDFSYYAHKLQMEKFNLDAEMLRPYFQLDKVVEGVFGLANKLYGISFKENHEIPVYHPDVKAYEVFDEDGSFLAVFYADFYPRDGKQGGAWMTEFQGQYINSKGENIRPHVSVVMNLTKPTASKPALLTLGEVETFLHEFGHSLHGMLANTRFESLSGTNVWWDFVEMPSQFMENYSTEKDFLRTFAFHYKTGEPIPDELIDRIRKSRNFNVAYACLRQVSFGLLDMAYYTQKTEFKEDIIAFEKKAWDKAMVAEQLPNTCMTTQFSHIMAGGYAAGYYSYKWAEVLDADAFSVFKKNGIFDRDTAKRLRSCVLSKGGTENPMTLYKRFRGQEPTIDALLVRNGIKEA
ncbi:peptidase M3 [Prevotella sp. S7-1-8]|uniref:M3 family metallopeptidase n=1 Tax=Prevotella sp. S7-1-8 TaxID=1284775 RepID=UPI00050FF853|nr:M3 family metallopeptidase [Prevotella sp. S7-1-8]KGF15813.1 peptidase M3 [Prevotella sp. S7-1-8]